MAHEPSGVRTPARRSKAPAEAAVGKPASNRRTRSSKGEADILERADWIAAARAMLIRDGAAAVKVERIATALNVTRGGFYWRFRDHADLLDALLKDWRETNSKTMLAALKGTGTPVERIWALMDVWVEETGYDPNYDIAVRAWGTISKKVARVVRTVDEERIDAIQKLFSQYGYDEMEASIRARVLYYHQVGYYAMGVKERKAKRHEQLKYYYKVLTGFREMPSERV